MKTNIGESLIESMSSSATVDTISEVAEFALDSTLNEGILKDIPVFGWIVKGTRVVLDVRDRILLKKIALFLRQLNAIDETQRIDFVKRILHNDTEKRKFGEKLILLLDRQESFEKSDYLGSLFVAYVRGTIERWEFDILTAGIDIAPTKDLNDLLSGYRKHYKNKDLFHLKLHGTLQRLVPTGFSSIRFGQAPWKNIDQMFPNNDTVWFAITEAGARFCKTLTSNYG